MYPRSLPGFVWLSDPDGGGAPSLGVGGVVPCDEWELPGQEIYTTVEEAGNWWLRSLYSDQ